MNSNPTNGARADNRNGRQTMSFRRRRDGMQPTPEQMKRQNDVLQCAWRHFAEAAPVIAFLNTRHEQLEGQPLHLAVESAEGLMRVEKVLEQMALNA